MGGYFSSEPSPDNHGSNESGEDQRSGSRSMEEVQSQSLEKAKKFRKPLVTILNEILRIKGKLNDDLVKENNAILQQFLETFIAEMKLRDPLFAVLFNKIYFTGSYYSDLRVSAPDEYDLNLVLKFPFKQSTVSEFEMLRKLFFDYLQHNWKYNDKGTRTKDTTNNIQDVKHGKPHCVKRRRRLFHNKHSMCKNMHDSYNNSSINGNTFKAEDNINAKTKGSNNSNEKLHLNPNKRNFQRRYPEFKKNNNSYNKLDNKSTQEIEKRINYPTKCSRNRNQDLNNENIKFVRFRKRNFKRKDLECKNNENTFCNCGSTSAQKVEKTTDYPYKDTKIGNQEKLHYVDPKRSYERKYPEYKTNENTLCNLDDIKAQRDDKNMNCHITDLKINNQDINHKSIKSVRHRKRNYRRKNFQYKNINNSLSNIEMNKVIPEALKSTSFSQSNLTMSDMLIQDQECSNESTLMKETNRNKNLNQKKVQVSKASKTNNNALHNLDNTKEQRDEKNMICHIKDLKINNQDINHKTIKSVRHRKRNYLRKNFQYKNINNSLSNIEMKKVIPDAKKSTNFSQSNLTISDMLVQDQECNNESTLMKETNRNKNLNQKKVQVSKASKTNNNALHNLDNTKEQRDEKNMICHIKDLKINNQDINHKTIKSVRHRRINYRRKNFQYKNINNSLSNIEMKKVIPDAKKSTSFSQSNLTMSDMLVQDQECNNESTLMKETNRNKNLNQKKVQVSKGSKINNNALHNLDNTKEQRDEKNMICHIKDLKINNQDINHKNLKPVRHRKRNLKRKHSQYKNINSTLNNIEINKAVPGAKKCTNFSQSNLTLSDMLIQDQKCKNENTLTKETNNNNENLNQRKIQISKARKRNIRRKNFRNKRCQNQKKIQISKARKRNIRRKNFRNKRFQNFSFKVKVNFDEAENLFTESNHKNYDELFNDFILNINSYPNGNELKNQLRNQAYVQYQQQVPSYAKYSTTDIDGISEKGLNKLFKDGYLIPNEVRLWLQSVVAKALRTYTNYPQKVKNIKTSASGPARTIILVKANGVIDIDLVPAIECSMDLKPPCISDKVYEKVKDNLKCFLVPKPYQPSKQAPINEAERARLWRVHYPEAEHMIIHNRGCVKPVIKLLKLLRDKEKRKILASYYLKTIVMWMVLENSTSDYWNNDRLGERFMDALDILAKNVKARKIRYFFSSNYNLVEKLTAAEADNIHNRLRIIIKDIEKDPENLWDIFGCAKAFSLPVKL